MACFSCSRFTETKLKKLHLICPLRYKKQTTKKTIVIASSLWANTPCFFVFVSKLPCMMNRNINIYDKSKTRFKSSHVITTISVLIGHLFFCCCCGRFFFVFFFKLFLHYVYDAQPSSRLGHVIK